MFIYVFSILCFVVVVFLAYIFSKNSVPSTKKESTEYISKKRKDADIELQNSWSGLEICNSFFEE